MEYAERPRLKPWLVGTLALGFASLAADWIPCLLTFIGSKSFSFAIGADLPSFYGLGFWLALLWIMVALGAPFALRWRALWLLFGFPCVINAWVFGALDD